MNSFAALALTVLAAALADGPQIPDNLVVAGHGFAKKKNTDYQFLSTILFLKETLLK